MTDANDRVPTAAELAAQLIESLRDDGMAADVSVATLLDEMAVLGITLVPDPAGESSAAYFGAPRPTGLTLELEFAACPECGMARWVLDGAPPDGPPLWLLRCEHGHIWRPIPDESGAPPVLGAFIPTDVIAVR